MPNKPGNRFSVSPLLTSTPRLLIIFSLLCICTWIDFIYPDAIYAQTIEEETNTEDVVRRVRFSGNDNIKDRTLTTLVRTRTNREFLNIPRFTPWYFIWKVSNGRFGEEPAYLNRQVVGNDMERLSLYYQSLGYLDVNVDTSIVEYRSNRIEVSFIIDEGPAYQIGTVSYSGMPDFPDPLKKFNFLTDSELTQGRINDTTFTVNRQYNSQDLSIEQQRIITFLKNNGYASIQRDSVIALVKEDSTEANTLDIRYRISPGKTYIFGDVRVRLSDTEPPVDYSEQDTLIGPPHTADSMHTVLLQKEPGAQSKFRLMYDQILFRPGDTYNHSLYLETVNEFQNLGMLYIRRFSQSEEQAQPDYSKEEIPAYYDLQIITKHSISSEVFGMKRYGYGTGFGIDYNNNNVFGNAENLTIGANASFEFVSPGVLEEIDTTATQSSVFRSYELRADYSVPRINFPFAFLDNRPSFRSTTLRYQFGHRIQYAV